METQICPLHTKPNNTLTWLSRAVALLFLYTSLTLSKNVTLHNTEVVRLIRQEYPTWTTVLLDVVVAFLVFGLLALIGFRILRFTEHHHTSKKWIARITKIETKFIRNVLTFTYSLIHIFIALSMALVLWKILGLIIRTFELNRINVPEFSTQPAVMLMGIFSLALLIHSFHSWNKGLAKLFCIRCSL